MKFYMLFGFILIMLIGTGFAQYPTTGNADAFKQALEKDGFTVQQGTVGYLDLIKLYD